MPECISAGSAAPFRFEASLMVWFVELSGIAAGKEELQKNKYTIQISLAPRMIGCGFFARRSNQGRGVDIVQLLHQG
jgi:hypothetical protein